MKMNSFNRTLTSVSTFLTSTLESLPDSALILRNLIEETQQLIASLEQAALDELSPNELDIVLSNLSYYRSINKLRLRQFNILKKNRKLVNKKLVDKIRRFGISSLLNSNLFVNKIFARDSKYVKEIVDKLVVYNELRKDALYDARIYEQRIKAYRNRYALLYVEENAKEELPILHCRKYKSSDKFNNYYYNKHKKHSTYYNNNKTRSTSEITVPPLIRSELLLRKLRARLYNFRISRLKLNTYTRILNYNPYSPVIATPNMETAQGDGVQLQDSKNNVTLMENTNKESVQTSVSGSSAWCSLTSSDIAGDYSAMTNRWIKVREFEWKSSYEINTQLTRLELPRDVVYSSDWSSCDLPNTVPFGVHRYWRGDCEVKVQVNSNKFQVGQLQVSWLYEPAYDPNVGDRLNVYTLSQAPHVLVSAGASNEATLYIPYKHHTPLLNCKTRQDLFRELHMGVLFVKVLNPLTIANSTGTSAYGSIFVRFNNCVFTGQVSGALNKPKVSPLYNIDDREMAEPQMDVAMKAAIGALTAIQSPNMDNPPNTSAPSYLVPVASHTWSIGNDIVEPLQQLRLQRGGQTAYVDEVEDEMSVKYITSKYGLVKQLHWSKNDSAGTMLLQASASPMLELEHYYSSSKSDDRSHYLATYALPPVAVISGLYNYWRGSLKFRFDIICSQFHTGRLIVAYIPGAVQADDDKINISVLLASPHMIFNLQDSQSFTYEVPYIAQVPFWPRNYQGNFSRDAVKTPSRIYMAVINPLIPMESVASTVYINVYMAGGDSFEVAVPVQPSIGTGYNPSVLYKKSEALYALSNSFPYYGGVYHSFLDSKYLCMRYGATSDNVAWFDKKYHNKQSAEKKIAIYYSIMNVADAPTVMYNGQLEPVKYAVGILDKDNLLLVPVRSEEYAKVLAQSYVVNKFNPNSWKETEKVGLYPGGSTSVNTYSKGNPPWKPESVIWVQEDRLDRVSFEGEREMDTQIVSTPTNLISTSNGVKLFGENFGHLKDLLRRYQVYGATLLDLTTAREPGQCAVVMPILPQGLALDIGTATDIMELANRARDGHIPIILSGYRYYRGSIRMRLVCPTNSDTIMWVQHRPDRKCRFDTIKSCATIETAEAIYNHGYASFIQDTGVNSILELEVPFYQNGAYGLLQRPMFLASEESSYFGNGELVIGFNATNREKKIFKDFYFSAFYSVGDDFTASTFQGFPMMVVLDNIENIPSKIEVAAPNMGLKEKVISWVGGNVTEGVKETISEEVTKIVGDLETKITEMKNEEVGKILAFKDTSLFKLVLNQLAHIVCNPNWKSVGIAIVTLLLDLKVFVAYSWHKLLEIVMKVLAYFKKRVKLEDEAGVKENQPDEAEVAAPEGEDTEEDVQGFIALIWTGVCSLFMFKKNTLTDSKEWFDMLTKDMTGIMRSTNFLMVFMKNIMGIIKKMYYRVIGYIDKRLPGAKFLGSEYDTYRGWHDEVLELIDPSVVNKMKHNPSYHMRVDTAFAQGSIFVQMIPEMMESSVSTNIKQMFEHIKKLKDMLVTTGSDSFVRREPYVIWQYGEAGVGKSFFSNHLAIELLNAANIKTHVPPVYNHSLASEFWDACIGNPVMQIDDMFAVQSGEMLYKQLALLFYLVSPVVLNPPKARLEDKGMAYNPEILLINSNYEHIRVDGMDVNAVRRRRNIILKTVKSNIKKPGCSHCEKNRPVHECPPQEIEDYHHLQFYYTKDVTRDNLNYLGPYTYSEIMGILKGDFVRTRLRNLHLYSQALLEQRKVISDSDSANVDMKQKIENYKRARAEASKKMVWENLCCHVKSIAYVAQDKSNYVWRYLSTMMHESIALQFKLTSKYVTPAAEPEMKRYGVPIIQRLNECYEVLKLHSGSHSTAIESIVANNLEYEEVFYYRGTNHIPYFGDTFEQSMEAFCRYMKGISWHWLEKREQIFNEDNQRWEVREIPFTHCPHFNYYSGDARLSTQRRGVDKFELYHGDVNMCEECGNEWCLTKSTTYQFLLSKCMMQYHAVARQVQADPTHSSLPLFLQCFDISPVGKEAWQMYWDEVKSWVKRHVLNKLPSAKTVFECLLLALSVFTLLISIIAPIVAIIRGPQPIIYEFSGPGWQQERGTTQGPAAYKSSWFNRTLKGRPTVAKPNSASQQSSVAIERVLQNTIKFTARYNNRSLACHGLVLRDRQVLLLRHYWEEYVRLPPHTSFTAEFCNRKQGNMPISLQFLEMPKVEYNYVTPSGLLGSNFIVVELPLKFPQCRDLTKFIATEKQHMLVNGEGVIVQNTGTIHDNVYFSSERARPVVVQAEDYISKIEMIDFYSYKMHGKGVCGSILICPSLERPIIGMHVAGIEHGNVRGLAEKMILETFVSMPKLQREYDECVIPNLTDAEFSKINLETAIFPLGCVEQQYSVYQSGETQIVPSEVHGLFDVETAPAPLKKNDERLPLNSSPLKLGCEHKGKPPRDFPPKLVKAAQFDLEKLIIQQIKPLVRDPSVLSIEQAVVGDPNLGIEPCEWSTSPGYPLRFMKDNPSQSGKKWLFDLELLPDGYKLKGLHPKLKNQLTVEDNMRKRGIKPCTIFIDNLKDSTIDVNKCSIPGKTRIFSISPIQYTIVFRQYFGHFMAAYRANRIDTEHAIGINVDSNEWTDVATYLQSQGEKIICGDYKNFGPSLMTSVVKAASEIILLWYEKYGAKEEDQRYRRILFQELLNPYYLVANLVYQAPCGVPSGSPITDIMNSLVNCLYIRCVWSLTTSLCVSDFRNYCNLLTYGDDVCINVATDIIADFNTATIADAFFEYNIIFTDCDKSDKIVKYRILDNATFLKRNFIPHPYLYGVWMAGLDKKSVQGCVNWIHKRNDKRSATVENCEQAVMLAHGHGPDYYNYILHKCRDALNELGLTMRYKSWEELSFERYSM